MGKVGTGAASWPRRIIDRSKRFARVEEELRCALSVLVVGDPTVVLVEGLVAELSRYYDLLASSLVFHRLGPNDLLLVLLNEEDAVHIYNEG